MGLVARQGFKAGTVTYLGVLLGVLNSTFVYPKMLSLGQLGEIQYIFSTAALLGPLLLFGMGSVLFKFYADYKEDEYKKQLFYGLVFGGALINVLLFLLIALLFRVEILQFFRENHGFSDATLYSSIVVSAIHPFVMLSMIFSSNHGRIAIPNLLLNFIKLAMPCFVVFYFIELYTFTTLLRLLVVYYLFLGVCYFWYIRSLGVFKPIFNPSEIYRKMPLRVMLNFAGFSFLGSFGAVLMNQIDIQMIAPFLGSYNTGLYTWSMFIANSLAIPLSLLAAIATPLISGYWKENDHSELNKVYGQSSRSLIVMSIGLFICIIVGLDDLFAIMPKGDEFALAKWTVIMLCTAKVIDMAAGLNSQILAMSKSYRYLLLFLGISVVFNVGLNALLIPGYGIEGSAVATVVSLLVYNILKYGFLRAKYNLKPNFNKELIVIPMGIILVLLAHYLPHFSSGFLNIFTFSGGAFAIYYFVAYKMKLAPELNEFVNKQLLRLRFKPFD